MARWERKDYLYVNRYEQTGCNQHGTRFKIVSPACLNVGRISVKYTDAGGLCDLILMSNMLDVPVRYDFEASPQEAYIEIVSAEALRKVRR